jgi:hypothetical protein
MITIILILNGLLAVFCFYLAWQMWHWRQALAQAADALIEAERVTHEVLHGAPGSIIAGQVGTYQLRQSYRRLGTHLHQLQAILNVISLGRWMWIKHHEIAVVGLRPARLQRSRKSV